MVFFTIFFIVIVGVIFIKIGKLGFSQNSASQILWLFGWGLVLLGGFFAFSFMTL